MAISWELVVPVSELDFVGACTRFTFDFVYHAAAKQTVVVESGAAAYVSYHVLSYH
jgi:hypothetical protein